LPLNHKGIYFTSNPNFRSLNGSGLQSPMGIEHYSDVQNPFVLAGGTQDNRAYITENNTPIF
jgi:hypothetical protein